MLSHLDDMVLLFVVPFTKIIEDLDLHQCLVMETLLIANDLDRNRFACLMVSTVQHLTKRALAQGIHDFIAESEMIAIDHLVIATFIIVAKVVDNNLRMCVLLRAPRTDAVNLGIVENLLLLIFGQELSLGRI